jgi:DNA helicase HerA-like ATPase
MNLGRRVYIVGDSGSGKTTLAKILSARLSAKHIELDSIYHQQGWRPLETGEFQGRVKIELSAESWVIDGNYSAVQPLIIDEADCIVWLDLPLAVTIPRVLMRSMRRIIAREQLWNGNKESILGIVGGKDALLPWTLRMHGPRRLRYAQLFFGRPHDKHVVRLCSPEEVRRWKDMLS